MLERGSSNMSLSGSFKVGDGAVEGCGAVESGTHFFPVCWLMMVNNGEWFI